jgi:hypothetical protein
VTGALLDLLDVGLLSVALSILLRRRPAAVVVCAALMLGGWGSNLLDRLGMHYWTAPGSVRGVVDFISVGEGRYNLADLFIVGATPLFLLAVGFLGWGAASRSATARAAAAAARNRPRARASMLALFRRRPHRGRCRARRGKLRRGEGCARARQRERRRACAFSRGRVVLSTSLG